MLFPDVNLIAPSVVTPVPAIVIGSATVIPPEIARAAPELTVVVPLNELPNADALEIASVPVLILVFPV